MAENILVIEDNQANLDLMEYLLMAFHYHVLTALDGIRGIEVARKEKPDLIICDIHLPGMDGYEVARRIKDNIALRDIPLVAVTAFAMVGDREKVLASGFDGYIPKPIDPQNFVGQVEGFFPSRRQPSHRPKGLLQPEDETVDRQALSPAGAAPPAGQRGAILVVDDTGENLDLIQSILQPSGYTVWRADTVEKALRKIKENRPDLIISDVHMPDRDGFDLLSALEFDPDLSTIPFVFLTSTYRAEMDYSISRATGTVKVLIRPIEPAVLLREVELILKPPPAEG